MKQEDLKYHKSQDHRDHFILEVFNLYMSGSNSMEVSKAMGCGYRTLLRRIGYSKANAGTNPENISEDAWGAVCMLLDGNYSTEDMSKRLINQYGKLLGDHLVSVVLASYNRHILNKQTLGLQEQPKSKDLGSYEYDNNYQFNQHIL